MTTKTGAQKIGKPTSQELPKVKGKDFNLRDRLNDTLFSEKHMMIGYTISRYEAADPVLYNTLGRIQTNVDECQRKFFNALFDLGEYNMAVAEEVQVKDAVQVFTGYRNQFAYDVRGEQIQ